jgi:hypothetical protein
MDLLARKHLPDGTQDFAGLRPHLGKMPFIGAEEQFILPVQNDNLNCCGTNIDTDPKRHGFTLFSENPRPFCRSFRESFLNPVRSGLGR